MLLVTFVPENYKIGEPLSFSDYDDFVFSRTEQYTNFSLRGQMTAFTGYETKLVVGVSLDDVKGSSGIDAAALAGRCHLFADFWTEPDRMILFKADDVERFDHALWAASGQTKEMTPSLIRDLHHCSDRLYAGYYVEKIPEDGVILDMNLRQAFQNMDLLPFLLPWDMTADDLAEHDVQAMMMHKFQKAVTDDFHEFCGDDTNDSLDLSSPEVTNRDIRWNYFLDSVFQLIIRMYDRHENGTVFYRPYEPNDWSLDLPEFLRLELASILLGPAVACNGASPTHTRKMYAGLSERARRGCHAPSEASKKKDMSAASEAAMRKKEKKILSSYYAGDSSDLIRTVYGE